MIVEIGVNLTNKEWINQNHLIGAFYLKIETVKYDRKHDDST